MGLISLTTFASNTLHNVIVSSFPADLITKMSYVELECFPYKNQ